MKAIKVEPDESGNYPEDAYFVFNEDGNGGDYFVDVTDITDEEYEELLPYVTLVECTKTSIGFNAFLRTAMICMWIILGVSLIILILAPIEPKIKWWIAIGSLSQMILIQMFANAIYENAKNNEKVSESILSLGKYLLKKNISNNKK